VIQEGVADKLEEVVTEDIWGAIKSFLNWGYHFGEGDNQVHITIGSLLLLIVSLFVASFVLRWTRSLFTRKMDEQDTLKFVSFFKFIKYVVYVIVFFVILSLSGVNVTPFLAASAALLVGVGLALREIFQDILGGILIMVDKSLLVGDIIEVDSKVGRVFDIKLRTSRALTRDNKVLIIPNHKFISDAIFNYTQNGRVTREFVRVGVAYGSDTELIKTLLMDIANAHTKVLKHPEPFVLFEDFGDSSLNFAIYFSINDSFSDPRIKSDIRFEIDKAFRENKVAIPFPQRDVHVIQKGSLTS